MSDTDIFNADKQSNETPATNSAELLNALVGEGKKYASAEELAKAYYNADNFMETLKDENRVLREQVNKVTELDEVLEQLKAAKQGSTQSTESEEGDGKAIIGAEDVAKLVKQTLVEEREAAKVQGNLQLADQKLKEVFGDKAKEVYSSYAKNPAMKDTLVKLAQSDPTAFVQFFVNVTGGATQNSSTVDSGTTVNSTNLSSVYSNRESDPETKEYYNALRQKNPSLYYSQDVQIKMNKAALVNSKKFFGT